MATPFTFTEQGARRIVEATKAVEAMAMDLRRGERIPETIGSNKLRWGYIAKGTRLEPEAVYIGSDPGSIDDPEGGFDVSPTEEFTGTYFRGYMDYAHGVWFTGERVPFAKVDGKWQVAAGGLVQVLGTAEADSTDIVDVEYTPVYHPDGLAIAPITLRGRILTSTMSVAEGQTVVLHWLGQVTGSPPEKVWTVTDAACPPYASSP